MQSYCVRIVQCTFVLNDFSPECGDLGYGRGGGLSVPWIQGEGLSVPWIQGGGALCTMDTAISHGHQPSTQAHDYNPTKRNVCHSPP